jgi:hypothetical protein
LIRSKAVCDGQTNDSLGPTCGRPFGLDFNILTQQLYVADAYFGLLVVGSNGRLGTILASGVNGTRFRFLNSVGLDPLTGVVYFTEFSAVYQLRYLANFSYLAFEIFEKKHKIYRNNVHERWMNIWYCLLLVMQQYYSGNT